MLFCNVYSVSKSSFFESWFYLNLHVGHHRLVILLQVVWLVHGLALGSQAIQVVCLDREFLELVASGCRLPDVVVPGVRAIRVMQIEGGLVLGRVLAFLHFFLGVGIMKLLIDEAVCLPSFLESSARLNMFSVASTDHPFEGVRSMVPNV